MQRHYTAGAFWMRLEYADCWAIRYKVGTTTFERSGFTSAAEARDYIINHTSAHVWQIYRVDASGHWHPQM